MATIRDVARAAGISPTVVSAVISGSGGGRIRVSSATADRVRQAAQSLDYRPNPLARGLANGRTRTVRLLLPFTSLFVYRDPFQLELLGGIFEELEGAGYDLLLQTSSAESWWESGSAGMLDGRAEGILMISPPAGCNLAGRCVDAGIPVVAVEAEDSTPGAGIVRSGSRDAAVQAVSHLIEKGHRRIAHLALDQQMWRGRERLAGYRAAMAGAGLTADERWILPAGCDRAGAARAAAELLSLPAGIRPTALFAGDDAAALGVLDAARAACLRLPADLALAGCDDARGSGVQEAGITSIRIPIGAIGMHAARLLLRALNGGGASELVELPGRLILRGSTG